MLFTRALLLFGAPSHRTEKMLLRLARELNIQAHFIQFPGITVISFYSPDTINTNIQVIKDRSALELGRLHETHDIYRNLMHNRCSPEEACHRIERLIRSNAIYGTFMRCMYSFGCSATICSISFAGGFADMWVAGLLSSTMMAINLLYTGENHIVANIFE